MGVYCSSQLRYLFLIWMEWGLDDRVAIQMACDLAGQGWIQEVGGGAMMAIAPPLTDFFRFFLSQLK